MSDLPINQLSDEQLRQLYSSYPGGVVAGSAEPTPQPASLHAVSDDELKRMHAQMAASPDLLRGATDTAARWATFGLSDLAGAAGTATGATAGKAIGGQPVNWSEDYRNALGKQRNSAELFRSEHPFVNAAAAGAGALANVAPAMGWPTANRVGAELPTIVAPPTLGGRIGAGAAVGGGAGAASGFANSPNGSLQDTLIGAGTGAGVGGIAPVLGELASVPINAFTRRFMGGADTQALDRIANRVAQSVKAGGPGASDIGTALTGGAGKPLAIADVAGEELKALAGSMTRQPGVAREHSTSFLGDRLGGMGPRLINDVDTALPIGSAFDTSLDLMKHRAAVAKPLWNDFYAQPPLNPDHIAAGGELDQFMSRPAMRDASQRALRIAAEEGRDPASLGITFNVAGDPIFERVPSWQTLDYVKRGLDDVINSIAKNPVTGRLQPDEAGRAVLGTKNAFLDYLDRNNPAYATARDAYAGDSAAMAAIQKGGDFRQMRPELIDYTLKSMAPSEREFFRLGAADALRQEIMRTGDPRVVIGTNAANNRGAEGMKQQLRPMFDSDAHFNDFIKNIEAESLMLSNTGKWIGNSATAGRIAEDRPHNAAGGPIGNALTVGGALAVGEPMVAATRAPALFSSLRNAGELAANNPAVNAATAKLLFNADPATNAETLAAIIARGRYPSFVQQAAIPLAGAAGSNPLIPLKIGGTLASILSSAAPAQPAGGQR